jgi:cellulose synthase/poly-beta-1,6-N-acetylglucosamine synthase-like glycosyltransferase
MMLLFGSSNLLTILTIAIFFSTYIIPPLVFERFKYFRTLFSLQLPGMLSYIACMPLYQIVFQLFSFANLHDVSWGNRDATADADI